ncbi:MAG: DNA polymerase III subunit delta [Bacteroidia bacterium]|nr:DNA polymerase III subunit delta [Bacteroidia bacterium]
MTFDQILQQIRKRQFAPVYYLYGEETYFIDKIAHLLDEPGAVLGEGEADFNRTLLYGPDVQGGQVINACRGFPVMAQHRLVIVREAHRLPKAEIEKISTYLKQPVPSTVLVLAWKDRKSGLPKAASDAAAKHGVVFHAKKMYDSDVQRWTDEQLAASGFEADPGLGAILTANLGANLNLIENELEKMYILLRATHQTRISKEFVFQMINVDKEFNVFELVHSLSEKDLYRAHLIADRLTQNTRLNPPVLIVNGLFQLFHHVALVHQHKLRDPNSVKNQFGVNYYQAKDYTTAAQKYSLAHTYRNIGYIQEADLLLKGMGGTLMDEQHIIKTLIWRLMAA